MAKKNIRSENPAPRSNPSTPDRRRAARAMTRTNDTPPASPSAERDGSPAVVLDTAEDRTQGDGIPDGHVPTYEEIAEAAYHRYLARGGAHGYDFDDWVEAERALAVRH